ncbi:hypothetical protein RND81_09G016000 [Saponaria officinalis]|uniref:Reverse transcriptase zinc-binding domain-containing protein n=1 Tax=Saponaria officinalis TaxID=3572 RepID=A0AAW1IGU3_SAPOF
MYASLMSKIMQNIQHWSTNLLSYAGKVQLINSVILGLQSFWCSCILLPKAVVDQVYKLCRAFFWASDLRGKLIFKNWSSICLPWLEGGFDIREVLAWNKALLARLLWRLDTTQDGVWNRWVQRYYVSDNTIWEVKASNSQSESFKSILAVRDQALTLLGDTQSVKVWLHSCLFQRKFSVARAYEFFRPRSTCLYWASTLQSQSVLPSHAIITTLAAQMRLPTVGLLCRRGLHLVNRCSLCKGNGECHRHLFFKCPYSKLVWSSLLNWMRISSHGYDLISELYWTRRCGHNSHWKTGWFRGCLAAAVYFIWNERNARIFNGRERRPPQLVSAIKYVVAIRCVASCSPSFTGPLIDALNS